MENFAEHFGEIRAIIDRIGTDNQIKCLNYLESVLFPLFQEMEEIQNDFVGRLRMMENEHERNLEHFQAGVTLVRTDENFEA